MNDTLQEALIDLDEFLLQRPKWTKQPRQISAIVYGP
jgi:hypothetical protein